MPTGLRDKVQFFLVIGHILVEIFIPMYYFLVLQMQAIACFPKDI